MCLTAAQQAASLPEPDKEYSVRWEVDEWASSPEEAALKVAKKYFQERIAQGENGSACLFYVNGAEVPLDYVVSEMTPDRLAYHFGYEHPAHTRISWMNQVQLSETISGYWEWVQHQVRL